IRWAASSSLLGGSPTHPRLRATHNSLPKPNQQDIASGGAARAVLGAPRAPGRQDQTRSDSTAACAAGTTTPATDRCAMAAIARVTAAMTKHPMVYQRLPVGSPLAVTP